jgi:putative DNA primase/helicase
MRGIGLVPPEVLKWDNGRFNRVPAPGDKHHERSGWYQLHSDSPPAGAFGDWHDQSSFHTWCARDLNTLSDAEKATHRAWMKAVRAQREAEDTKIKTAAAELAARILKEDTEPCPAHPYTTRKGVQVHGLRMTTRELQLPCRDGETFLTIPKGALVVPLSDVHGKLWSLQFIFSDGTKRFLPGGRKLFFLLGKLTGKPGEVVLVAEGFATGATLHEATGHPVLVALDAGNMTPVVEEFQAAHPGVRLGICPDDDHHRTPNTGIEAGKKALAAAHNGTLIVPALGPAKQTGATDFNDWAQALGPGGLDVIKMHIENTLAQATAEPKPSTWDEPQPLVTKIPPEPYPLAALPPLVLNAVEEVVGFVQCPTAMAATSALSIASLAVQGLVDVERAPGLKGPTSIFVVGIASSGERKTTCDRLFGEPARKYEMTEAIKAEPLIAMFKADHDTWDARRRGQLSKIEKLAKEGKPTTEERDALRGLQISEPKAPKVPRLTYVDSTTEAMAHAIHTYWPSAGVISSEGGSFLGSYSMGADCRMRNLSLMNILWDGGAARIDRKTSESFTVTGRLTLGLQVQEEALRQFCDDDGLAQGIGFLPRCLVAWPDSTQGSRMFREAPSAWPALTPLNQRILQLFETPVVFDDDGELAPAVLRLSPDAKAEWIRFHDQVERDLAPSGEFIDVRATAAKAAENAARIAAILHVVEHGPTGEVEITSMMSGSAIAAWHLNEARRFFGEIAMPRELADAARLEAWLIAYCDRKHVGAVPAAQVQKSGPGGLRAKAAVEAALGELAVLGRVRVAKVGHAKSYELNPALLGVSKTARTATTSAAKLKDKKETMTHCINQEEVEI